MWFGSAASTSALLLLLALLPAALAALVPRADADSSYCRWKKEGKNRMQLMPRDGYKLACPDAASVAAIRAACRTPSVGDYTCSVSDVWVYFYFYAPSTDKNCAAAAMQAFYGAAAPECKVRAARRHIRALLSLNFLCRKEHQKKIPKGKRRGKNGGEQREGEEGGTHCKWYRDNFWLTCLNRRHE